LGSGLNLITYFGRGEKKVNIYRNLSEEIVPFFYPEDVGGNSGGKYFTK
jgi:hypothetical protein